MDSILEIQKEFEVLVSQLERLKNINELTSSNAENAKKIVLQINTFMKSIDTYRNTIEADYKAKSEKIEELLSAIEKVNLQIDKRTKDLPNIISSSINIYKEESNQYFKDNFTDINNLIKKSTESNNDLKTKLIDKIEKIRATIFIEQGKVKTEILDKLDELNLNINNSKVELSNFVNKNNKKFNYQKRLLFIAIGIAVIGTILSIVIVMNR